MTNTTVTTIARAELIEYAVEAAENICSLNVEALRLYIPEVAEALPEAIPVTTTARELEKLLLNNAGTWTNYCRSACAFSVSTHEILARHYGEEEAKRLINIHPYDWISERGIHEQASFLTTAAERLRFAFKELALAVNTLQEEGIRNLKTLAEEGLKRICLLDVGHRTASGGATYIHYRALYCEGRSVRDCTRTVAAALGLKTAKGGDISVRGFTSAPAEVEQRLQALLPDLKVSSELVW